jgi:uncharacterized protein YaaW (UPF0174 family)
MGGLMQDLNSLLSLATGEQLKPLVSILDTNQCRYASKEEVITGIKWLHRNIFESINREFIFEKSESYADILCTLLKKMNVVASPTYGCEALEEVLVKVVFQQMWANFSTTQRLDLEENYFLLIEQAGKSHEWKKIGGIAGAMTAAKLGGFSTYILASSALSTISNIVGVTLPFTLYKAVSSTISLAIGSLGWLGLAVFATYKLSGTNYQKLIPAAIYISMLRYELSLRPNKVIGSMVIPHDYVEKRGVRLL